MIECECCGQLKEPIEIEDNGYCINCNEYCETIENSDRYDYYRAKG